PVGVRRVPLHERPIRIGSSPECDLVLPGRVGVVAEHAMIWRRGDAIILHVTDPAALCRVNGEDVSWASLDDGDAVAIGDVIVRIEVVPPSH
ncbi:MAG: FHA domain-containing protein, partial [Chloroflexi bacterium]|nr:FHA domain-containing protein [Chloroflexota bacterium]